MLSLSRHSLLIYAMGAVVVGSSLLAVAGSISSRLTESVVPTMAVEQCRIPVRALLIDVRPGKGDSLMNSSCEVNAQEFDALPDLTSPVVLRTVMQERA